MRIFAISWIVAAGLFASSSASAQDREDRSFSDSFGQVVCHSQSLTVCQDEFCFVAFDCLDTEKVVFDFVLATYVYPAIGKEAKPMRIVDVVQTEGHYAVKFGVDLVHGSSNVNFIANRRKDGAIEMSAAGRIVYPGNTHRSPIVAINGMACENGAR